MTTTVDLRKKYSELVLSNKKVTVKAVDRKNPNMPKGYDGEFMFTGCKRTYRLPRKQTGGYLQFLSSDEIEAYENLLGYDPGELSYFKKKDNFWDTFKISLGKEGAVLDCNDPYQSLQVKMLAVQREVAESWDERRNNPGEYWFALVDEDVEVKDRLNAAQLKAKAYKLLSKIEGSPKKMSNTLKVLGKRPTPDAKSDWLYAQLGEIIEQTQVIKGVRNIHDFITVREDPDFDLRVFIEDAIKIGEIERRGTVYHLNGGDRIGGKLDDVIEFFKDKSNSDIYKIIESQIK